ncbi:MAG: DUF945 family protein [Aeromonas sp.]
MKKTVALAVAAALVGGGLAACWYTGNSFDRIMAEQITQVKSQSGIELQWLPSHHSLFARDGVLKVVVSGKEMAALEGETSSAQPLELQLQVTNQILPLYIKSQLTLDTHQGSLAPTFTKLGMAQWQLGLKSASNFWTQSNSSQLKAGGFAFKQASHSMTFLPLEAQFQGDLTGSGELAMTWQGMSFDDAQSKMALALANMKGRAEMAQISGIMLSPQSEMSLGSLTLQLPDSGKLSLQDMTTATELIGDDAKTLSNSYSVKIAKLDLENEGDSLALTDSKLALTLKGLDLEGYQQLQAASGQSVDDVAVEQAMNKMLMRGATLELSDLSSTLNGAPIAFKGDLQLAPTSLAQLFNRNANRNAGMKALSGTLHANLSNTLGNAVPQLAGILNQLTRMGLLKADQQNLTSLLQLKQGALTVNNKRI